MAPFSYSTIQAPSKGLYKEKGSKFLAFAYPVSSEAEIKDRLKSLRKEYFDARHHGYAYVLGPAGDRHRAVDDGEPGHSTGDPILGQIKARNLTDVLVVVVRYFGGVKLGVGGLMAAYKTAAADALRHAVPMEKQVMRVFRLQYDYDATPEVMRLIRDFGLVMKAQDFGEMCSASGEVPLRHLPEFTRKVQLLKATGTKIDQVEF